MYTALTAVKGGRFTIAAAFGNVHGVYSPGNVQLTPDILHNCQKYIKEKDSCDAEKPATFVFHGAPRLLPRRLPLRRLLPRLLPLAAAIQLSPCRRVQAAPAPAARTSATPSRRAPSR